MYRKTENKTFDPNNNQEEKQILSTKLIFLFPANSIQPKHENIGLAIILFITA